MATQSVAVSGMTADDLWPKRYLTVHDLKGEARVVTIEDITKEVIRDIWNDEWKTEGVIWFAEFPDKFFCVNRMNKDAILGIVGSRKLKDWIGTQVMLVPTLYQRGKIIKDVIRVKAVRKLRPAKKKFVVTKEGFRSLVNELGVEDEAAKEIWLACNKDFNQAAAELKRRYGRSS